jgi:hypothetical protein
MRFAKQIAVAAAVALSIGVTDYAHADPKAVVDAGIAAAIAGLHTAAEATFGVADPWMKAHVWDYTTYAACLIYNNKYALRAFDASEAKNQPAPIACVKP